MNTELPTTDQRYMIPRESQAGHKFQPGHVSLHDLSAAGRASRKVSPWGKVAFTKRQMRTRRLELIKRAAKS